MSLYGDKDLADIVDLLDSRPSVRLSSAPLYLTWLADALHYAGVWVIEYEGWQTRARGSGGFPAAPLCVMWHHTASPVSWDGRKDADYIATGDEDAPLANLYIERSGAVWVLAAGATNTNGKGKSLSFSRGTVPADSMNTHAVGIEMGNDGLGEPWPEAQVDAAFIVSNTINQILGNIPADLATHQHYAPDRKIDPATAAAVQGSWQPRSCTSSGSWDVEDVRQEASRRAGEAPVRPQEPPGTEEEGDSMRALVRHGSEDGWHNWIVNDSGKFWLPTQQAVDRAQADFGYFPIWVDDAYMETTGPVQGDNPTNNSWGKWDT